MTALATACGQCSHLALSDCAAIGTPFLLLLCFATLAVVLILQLKMLKTLSDLSARNVGLCAIWFVSDKDYKEFLASLDKPPPNKPSAEVQLEQREKEEAEKAAGGTGTHCSPVVRTSTSTCIPTGTCTDVCYPKA